METKGESLVSHLIRERSTLPPSDFERRVLESYQDGQLSAGKAAELLGMPLCAFLRKASERGISVFDASPEELAEDLRRARDTSQA